VDVNENVRAQVGFGPNGSNANDNDGWTWFDANPNADFNGNNAGEANNDEYQGTLIVPNQSGSTYSFAIRFTVDAGQTWTACDGTGEGSSNGYQSINAGRFTINEIICVAEEDCPIPEDENCIPACINEACAQFCAVEGCPDPRDEAVVYASQDTDICD
jgi:hypothetical protein